MHIGVCLIEIDTIHTFFDFLLNPCNRVQILYSNKDLSRFLCHEQLQDQVLALAYATTWNSTNFRRKRIHVEMITLFY